MRPYDPFQGDLDHITALDIGHFYNAMRCFNSPKMPEEVKVPSEDEIDEEAKKGLDFEKGDPVLNSARRTYFTLGAKWMRDKLLNR